MIEPTQAGTDFAQAMAVGFGGGLALVLVIIVIISAIYKLVDPYDPVAEANRILQRHQRVS